MRPLFVAIPVPRSHQKLRQLYCPNSDHAKFFFITQAHESRRFDCGAAEARGFEASAPRSGPRSAEFEQETCPESNPAGAHAAGTRESEKKLWRRGCYRSDGDE